MKIQCEPIDTHKFFTQSTSSNQPCVNGDLADNGSHEITEGHHFEKYDINLS